MSNKNNVESIIDLHIKEQQAKIYKNALENIADFFAAKSANINIDFKNLKPEEIREKSRILVAESFSKHDILFIRDGVIKALKDAKEIKKMQYNIDDDYIF